MNVLRRASDLVSQPDRGRAPSRENFRYRNHPSSRNNVLTASEPNAQPRYRSKLPAAFVHRCDPARCVDYSLRRGVDVLRSPVTAGRDRNRRNVLFRRSRDRRRAQRQPGGKSWTQRARPHRCHQRNSSGYGIVLQRDAAPYLAQGKTRRHGRPDRAASRTTAACHGHACVSRQQWRWRHPHPGIHGREASPGLVPNTVPHRGPDRFVLAH